MKKNNYDEVIRDMEQLLPNINNQDGDRIQEERVSYLINQKLHMLAERALLEESLEEVEDMLIWAMKSCAQYCVYLPSQIDLTDKKCTWKEYVERHHKKT